jgi:hypothetical protein
MQTSAAVAAELISGTTQASPGQEVRFALVNHGPGRVSFGVAFELEREERGRWVRVPFGPENMAWPAVAISLRPRTRYEQAVRVPAGAQPGRYRVSKSLAGCERAVSFEFAVSTARAAG